MYVWPAAWRGGQAAGEAWREPKQEPLGQWRGVSGEGEGCGEAKREPETGPGQRVFCGDVRQNIELRDVGRRLRPLMEVGER